MNEDQTLLILTGIGLAINILSIRPLRNIKYRNIIKKLASLSMILGFIFFTLIVVAQSSTMMMGIFFYSAIFLWNLGFFEWFFIIFVKVKTK